LIESKQDYSHSPIYFTVYVESSRVANYIAQVLLRPAASDLTGSFRLEMTLQYL